MKKLVQTMKANLFREAVRTRTALSNNRGSGLLDIVVGILISVVLGALLLAGLYALFGQSILPSVTQKVKDMFNYAG